MVTGDVQWWFRQIEAPEPVHWDWGRGAPRARSVQPWRRPQSGDRSRHIPVRAYSIRTGTTLRLESGLEHDLVRELDRDTSIAWMVPQPFQLRFTGDGRTVKHVPDLLVQNVTGAVTVWDVRPTAKVDEKFARIAELTGAACRDVGWDYQLFHGLAEVERLNSLWLHGFRYEPAWAGQWAPTILDHLRAASGRVTVGELLDLDDGSGEAVSAMWHLLWAGRLEIDSTVRWTEHTPVRLLVEQEVSA